MTAKKRLTSIICIISLVLAITAGILLSVGAQPINNNYYGEESASLSNTAVTVKAESATKHTDEAIDGTAIATVEELQKFINAEEGFDGNYGYLTANISLDWEGVGSGATLASGRTLDGNGWTVTLADADATQYTDKVTKWNDDGCSVNEDNGGLARGLRYGMFVDTNEGTIKNIKFVYSQAAHGVAYTKTEGYNYAGIVCGYNSGTIQNCDLTASGQFGYYYANGSVNQEKDPVVFAIKYGGFAGLNANKITYVTAQYNNFDCILNVRAQNPYSKGGVFGIGATKGDASARAAAGGIAGAMCNTSSEISNVIVLGTVTTTLTAQRVKGSGGDSIVGLIGYAAVVPGANPNSSAEGDIKDDNDNQAKIDNIIVDCVITGNKAIKESFYSRNAVIHCGTCTNVTILTVGSNRVQENQHVDYQVDHCNCGTTNTGYHKANYGNIITTDANTDATVGFDDDGNQVITVEPKDKANTMLGEIKFNKYEGRATVTDGSMEGGLADPTSYSNVVTDGTTYLYNNASRQSQYDFIIRPYQGAAHKFWELEACSYEIGTISNVGATEYTYTGKDYLASQFEFAKLTNAEAKLAVDPAGLNAIDADGGAVTSGRLPKTYTFTLEEKEAGLAYIDKTNKIVAFAEETPTEYSFTVNLAEVADIEAQYLADNWMKERHDFEFAIKGEAEADAVDGYLYETGGSLPTPSETGLTMQNNRDTSSTGRTYKIQLTSGGVVVTEPYEYTVKIDMTAPTAEIIHAEHPEDRYYTHNTITISATDKASGVASIVMDTYTIEGEYEHSHNVIEEATLNDDGTYTWRFQDTGISEIIVTDNAGNSSKTTINILIDKTEPTIDVDAYYYTEGETDKTDGEGNYIWGIIKEPYVSGTPITSAVYFDVTATFGESGGEIRYSLNNGKDWQVLVSGEEGTLTETLMVKTNGAKVKFKAVSNTYDHEEGDVAPYPTRYRIFTQWDQTVTVDIQLEKVEITLEDLVISDAAKPFDGTADFDLNNISVREDFVSEKNINGEVTINSVKYASVNVGENIALVIDVTCTDDTKVIDNKIEGAVGKITKREITVTVDNATKIYGVKLPKLTYTQSGMIEGYIEELTPYVVKPDGFTDAYELLPKTDEGYDITVDKDTVLDNYKITSVTDGKLMVTLAPIDRFVYEKGQFTGLDTNNIASRNLEIGFIRSNGEYEKLKVTFYARDYYRDDNDKQVDKGYTKAVDITTAGNGFYKVIVSLPDVDSKGETLSDKYVISDKLFLKDEINEDKKSYNFFIKIIDASIFDVKKEEPTEEAPVVEEQMQDTVADNQVSQSAPIVNNSENGQVGIYEDGSATTDSTDTTIENVQQKKDYIAMVSIFCAVAIMIAFAFGVGKAITKRIRR